ncbi:hypothetical protein LJY25_18060 [Hymenobacter sp. BT175]|uniref:hypothetical protein n=1 Tax=Hymenobacter translucens TaxID=2886507 RepID=UPI001D0E3079|nr:hypothetical protein [Hymenobacter translucens]MCC2548356.1 hypothetical protein [Hymenobacter translucens]
MARTCLVLLLLTHYLLVVGAGLVNRPARPIELKPHAYTHSTDCQQRSYLRVDCFDTCNGQQYAVKKHPDRPSTQQILHSLKGVDLHCQVAEAELLGVLYYTTSKAEAGLLPSRPVGFSGEIFAPPRYQG